jgi:hypothetical protein
MRQFFVVASFVCAVFLGGCPSSTAPVAKKPATNGHSHDHDHDHSHEEKGHTHAGPHGGKVAVIGKEQYHLEWTHNDETGKVTFYVLDSAVKKDIPISAEKLVVVSKQGDKSTEFELDAIERTEGKTAKFEITSKDFLGIMETLSEKMTAEVKQIDINDSDKFSGVKLIEHECTGDH